MAITLALTASAFFAGQLVIIAAAVRTLPTHTVLWCSTFYGCIASVVWIFVLHASIDMDSHTVIGLLAAGVFAPLTGRALFVTGLRFFGSNISTPIVMIHPAIAVLLAIVVLGEPMGLAIAVGGVLVIGGSFLVAFDGKAGVFQGVKSLALAFPILACFAYGVSLVLRKSLMSQDVDSVSAAALVLAPAFVGYSIYYAVTGNMEAFRFPTGKGGALLVLGGLVASVASIVWLLAMKTGDLVVIAPMAAITPLFALLLSWLFFSDVEILTRKVVLGTFITVTGVALTTIGSLQ